MTIMHENERHIIVTDTHLNLVKLIPPDDHLHASIALPQKLDPILHVRFTSIISC